MNEHINALKKKSDTSYSAEEIALIKNQNDYMRTEIKKRDERISELSRQVNAPFILYEIYSEDKLQYVADGLNRAKIPFIEDSNALHIPEYALKTANVIASHYKPTTGTIREKIALDIDRLIFNSENVEELLNNLKERGYEIKRGKYIALKAPFAERFIRLKSLGEEYLPNRLEKRIAERDSFTDIVRKQMRTGCEVERDICAVILETTAAVREFRIIPRKTKPEQIYTYRNDENINYLSEQLLTIGEFGISSHADILAKSEQLKKSVDDKMREAKALSDEIPTLKSEIAQIRRYFDNSQNCRRLDTMEQVKLAAAKEIVEKRRVRSEEDIAALEERLKLLPTYISSVRNSIAEEQAKLNRVSELMAAYERVVEGNYIDNLIKAQGEREQTKSGEKRM
jgi:hypothetical protein